jgi:HlyD family secretion protein
MLRKLILPLLALVLLGFAVFHVVRAQQEPPKSPPPVDPARNPFRGTIAGSGVVEPRSENIAIGSHLSGVVADVLVAVGDRVKVGTPLFRLDDRQLQAELAVRKANLTSTEANLRKLEAMPRPEEVPSAEAKVREAQANLENMRQLHRRAALMVRNQAIGEEEYVSRGQAAQMAEAQLAKAQADLDLLKKGAWEADKQVARAAVEQAQAMVQQTETELQRLEVRSSIDGEVLQKNVRPGEYVGNAPGQALMVLGDLSRVHVRIDLDENDIDRFRPNLAGRATPRGNPRQEVPLRFVRVEPYVVPKKSLTGGGTERVDTRVLQVIYAVERSNIPLYVGQQLDVYLDTSENDQGTH